VRALPLTPPDGLIITKLERHPEGYWTANVNLNGAQVRADSKHGSWQTTVAGLDGEPVRRELRPNVAAVLAAKVKTEERRAA
jgi:hypothetical protein